MSLSGLTFDKLLIVGVLAVFLLGPDRLPVYAAKLAQLVKTVKNMANGAKERMRSEMGPEFDDVEWQKLDPRQYDPRRIVREALQDPPAPRDEAAEQALRVRPGQTHVVTGSAAHPRRVRVDALAVDDPRRIAAAAGERRLPDAQPGTPAS